MSSMSIICITAIVGLSAMGVGYGYWNDNLNIGVGISTGYLKPEFDVDESELIGNIGLSLEGNTLNISGNVSEGTDGVIRIKINNNSSIPVVLDREVIGVGGHTMYEINIPPSAQAKALELRDEDILLIQTLLKSQDEELDINELIDKLGIENKSQPGYMIYDELTFKQELYP